MVSNNCCKPQNLKTLFYSLHYELFTNGTFLFEAKMEEALKKAEADRDQLLEELQKQREEQKEMMKQQKMLLEEMKQHKDVHQRVSATLSNNNT